MKKNILALIVVLIAIINFSFAQDPVVVNFSNETGNNSTVTVDVTCEDFENIIGMQLFIGWDENVLEFNDITNINSELDGFNGSSFATPNSTPEPLPEGHVNISWFTNNIFGDTETLPDGTILFSIVLDVVGDPCDETLFELVDFNGQPNEAYDGDFSELAVIFNAGTVEIPGTDCGGSGGDGNGLGLIAETLVAAAGTNVCVEITVDSFVNINTAQFAVQYDTSVLEFTGFIDGPLSDENANQPPNSDHIRFLWIVPADEDPASIPDGDVIVEFCFNVIGEFGECSPIDIVSIPGALEIEFIDEFGSVVEYYAESGEVCIGNPPENPVTFIASDEVGDGNSNVCIDITTENFEDIGGFQWAFSWDSNVMTYDGLGSTNNIGINPTDIVPQNDGLVRVSWFPTSGVSLDDGTVLFQLCFDLIGDCGDDTEANFVNDGADFLIEVGDADGQPLPHAVVNGSVSIECACFITVTDVVDVRCNGDADGAIYISLNGCTAQSFNWSNGANTQNLVGIGAGNYQVTVTDSNGAEIISNVITVDEPTAVSVTGTVTNKSCENLNGGSIQLSVSGGTPGYEYSWNPSISTGSSAINLDPGVYSVTVSDDNDCEKTESFTVISTITALEVTGSKKDVICKGDNNGEIDISADGACSPYNISWSDGADEGVFNRKNLAAGSFTATVTDASGAGETISFTITEPAEALSVTGNVTNAIVGGNGSVDITIVGGEEPYEVNWSNGAVTVDITAPAGSYTVYIDDARGCSIEATYVIDEKYDKVTIEAEQASNLYNGYGVSCFGECDGKINMTVTGNAPFTLYLDGVEIPFEDFPQENFCAGDYTIKIVDDEGLEETVTVSVDEPDQLVVEEDEILCSTGEDGSIAIDVSGGVGDYVYNWGNPSLDGDFLENLVEGNYGVVVTDENKCQALLSDLEVTPCPTGECFIATPIITPNNDGFNDSFIISCLRDYPENQLDVFDRWGRKVYSVGNYDGSWQGVGTDGQLDEGTYMYVLTAFLGNGDERIYKGTVTILW